MSHRLVTGTVSLLIDAFSPLDYEGFFFFLQGCTRTVRAVKTSRSKMEMDGDVAQLVEHLTGTSLTQVRFHGAARFFSSKVNFQCRLSYGVRVQSHAFTSVCTLKIP